MNQELVLPSRWIGRDFIEKTYFEAKERATIAASEDFDAINASLQALSATPGGTQELFGKTRTALLREMLYEGSWRNIFSVYKLVQGELPNFGLDIAVPAAHVGMEGLPEQPEIRPGRWIAETSFFASNPYVLWTIENRTAYDVLNATQQRAKASLLLQESSVAWQLVRYSSGLRSGQGATAGLENTSAYSQNAAASQLTSVAGKLSYDQLAIGQAGFGARLQGGPQKLVINPYRKADLALLPLNTGSGLSFFVPEYSDDMIRKHFMGTVLGMNVFEDILVPTLDTNVYVDSILQTTTENIQGYITAPNDTVGVCMIRTDLSIETMKDVNRFADVFGVWMDTGFVVVWVKGFQRLTDAA